MQKGSAEKNPGKQSDLKGSSLGELPTENLLQMIGNLRLSTRLLLENSKAKDFCIITFREGDLVPEIESSDYPSLKEALEKNPEIQRDQLEELAAARTDMPFWNRLLVAGLVDREVLKDYLVDGIRLTLSRFANLSGIHFELSPIPTDRLGTSPGYQVDEICALVRGEKPEAKPLPEAEPKETIALDPRAGNASPPALEASGLPDQQALTSLLRQLRGAVPGMLATYLVDCRIKKPLASSTARKPVEGEAGFQPFCEMACDNLKGNLGFRVREHFLSTPNYLIGIRFISPGHSVVAICPPATQLGLLITELRRAGERTADLLTGGSK
jgi:hypothetical protein